MKTILNFWKEMLAGVIIMLIIWGLMPIMASVAAENEFKIDQTGNYVAIFPSVRKGMDLMSSAWWIFSFIIAVVAGCLAGYKKDDAVAGQKLVPSVGIGLLASVICWFMLHSPATAQHDFTHKTIEKSAFDEKVAARGGYDYLFKEFNQTDELYLSPAVFANPQ